MADGPTTRTPETSVRRWLRTLPTHPRAAGPYTWWQIPMGK